MVKKISTLALAGLLALPALASAGAGGAAGTSDIQAQVDALTQQLNSLKAQMANMKTAPAAAPATDQSDRIAALEDRAANWDLASRIQLSGDFRARGDYYSADTKGYVPMIVDGIVPGSVKTSQLFNKSVNFDGANPLRGPVPAATYKNNSDFTNRFRLDMRAKALENVEFKGRLAMYKTWGMQNDPLAAPGSQTNLWDGNASRQPNDSILRVDRAFVNWNNIGGVPVWFSIGRRPTTDGPPTQLRMNSDERIATPTAVMDYPFDGVSVGYAYNNLFGIPDAPGRIRFCWGRGFESGLNSTTAGTPQGINDTDFAGASWDIYKKGSRFVYLQSFAAMDLMNYPSFSDPLVNQYYDFAMPGGRMNIGNLIHTSGVYQDKWQNLNYFGMLGWSRTDPNDMGMMNTPAALFGLEPRNTASENGYVIHVGARYDIPDSLFKIGAEYNHGSKYWVGLTPGNDDLYSAGKLSTRGNVYEVYGIFDIPGGEAVSKYGKAFMRLGYQHYDYNYTGSGDWNLMPVRIEDAANSFQLAPPVESADQVYLTFEAAF
ncbi:MAG: DUF3373 family protein [Desulfurivibrionaceae bacterium]